MSTFRSKLDLSRSASSYRWSAFFLFLVTLLVAVVTILGAADWVSLVGLLVILGLFTLPIFVCVALLVIAALLEIAAGAPGRQ